MKKLLLILLFLPMIGFGQDNTEFIQIQQEINIIKENLNEHHINYKTGFFLGLIGGCSSIIGSSILVPQLAIGGAVLSMIGGVVMFSSHKWFGKKKMKGHFIIGKRNKQHSLKNIYHKGDIWKIGQEIEYAVISTTNKNVFKRGKIENIILHSNDEVVFEVKLVDGNTVYTDWFNIIAF